MWIFTRFMPAVLIMSSIAVIAAPTGQAETTTAADTQSSDPQMDLKEVIALLKQQQKDLASQKELLQAQAQQIASLKDELDVLRAPTPPVVVTTEQLGETAAAVSSTGSGDDRDTVGIF